MLRIAPKSKMKVIWYTSDGTSNRWTTNPEKHRHRVCVCLATSDDEKLPDTMKKIKFQNLK